MPPILAALLAVAGGAAIAVATVHRPHQPALSSGVPVLDSAPAAIGGGPDPVTGPLMDISTPTRVIIPALNISVPVIGLGQLPDGSMQVPADAKTVGWYTKAPTPGSLGPAVLAGHVDYRGHEGTFAHLDRLRAGDPITVHRQDGSTAVFVITSVERYAKDRFPSNAVYGPTNHAGLRLITCGGDFDNHSGHYVDNIVAYADLRTARKPG
jgi:hypothetical protein